MEAFPPNDGTCYGLLQSRAAKLGNRQALVFEDREWTWSGLIDAVDRVARYFRKLGIGKGDRVAIVASNSDFYAIAFLASARIGAASATINGELEAESIAKILKKVRPKLILTSPDRADKLSGFPCAMLEASKTYGPGIWELSSGADAELPQLPGPDATCLIMFTSGTTGDAKGVMHAQRSFVLSGEGFVRRMALTKNERILCVLPLFHVNALFYSFAGALAAGAAVIFERRFSASRFWKTASKYGATQVNLIAAAGNILLRRDRSEFVPDHSLKKVYLSPLTRTLHDGFQREFQVDLVREGYGLTEAPGVINQPVDEPPQLGSMGRISRHPSDGRPLAETKILDPSGKPVEAGAKGELWIRSPILMQGYFEDPESTSAVLQEGWFRTGDLVRKNADDEFFFIERIKDIIRRRGENISGAELDRVISGHPFVAQVAVVATPSELGEDEILAAIVLNRELSPKSFKDWCEETLPPHKQPRYLAICDDLPRTPSEKIEKYKIKRDPSIRENAVDLTKL